MSYLQAKLPLNILLIGCKCDHHLAKKFCNVVRSCVGCLVLSNQTKYQLFPTVLYENTDGSSVKVQPTKSVIVQYLDLKSNKYEHKCNCRQNIFFPNFDGDELDPLEKKIPCLCLHWVDLSICPADHQEGKCGTIQSFAVVPEQEVMEFFPMWTCPKGNSLRGELPSFWKLSSTLLMWK